jgi:predicted transposase YdaD
MADRKDNTRVFSPHDKLIRDVYGNRDNAHSFLTNNLPEKVLDLVDMSTLEICKDSFIEKELADYYFEVRKWLSSRFPKRREDIS